MVLNMSWTDTECTCDFFCKVVHVVCQVCVCMCVKCVCESELLHGSEPLRPAGLLISTLSKPLLSHRSPLRNVFIIFCFSLLRADEYTRAVNQISHSVCHACVLLVCKCHD